MEGLAVSPDGKLFGTDSLGIFYQISSTTGLATKSATRTWGTSKR